MEMEKGERRKRERGEEDILRSFICTMVPYLAPLLSLSPLPLLSPRKPFDDSPPLPLRDLRHIAFGMAVRGEREGSEGGLIWSWRGLPAGTDGCGDGRRGGGKPDVATVPSLGRDGSGGGG